MAKCDWYDGTLSVVLPEDPERIAVRMFDSRLAPARLYVPEVETLALRDENAKLRGARNVWQENDVKMRELLRDVYILHRNGLDCTECPWFAECNTTSGCPWLGIFANRLCELGILEREA